jgi:alanine racemase
VSPAEHGTLDALLGGRRSTWIEIDLDALEANYRALAAACGRRPIWAVVKADAYGHGAVACSRVLAQAGVAGLVVALPEEGIVLRRAGLDLPILLCGPLPADGAGSLIRHRLLLAVSHVEDLRAVDAAAGNAGAAAEYHLELDSGMTRMGLAPEDLAEFLDEDERAPYCQMTGVMSHLASVSRPDDPAARRQLDSFHEMVVAIRARLRRPVPAHLASSPALCAFPDAWLDMIRPGLLLYGVRPHPRAEPPPALAPVLSFRATVSLVRTVAAGTAVGYDGTWTPSRDTRVAIVSAGYGDGLRRDVSGRAEALVQGHRLPFVGAVNMDLAQLEVSEGVNLHPGQTVTLIGVEGDEAVALEELVERTGRTPYEWLTGLGPRVPRLCLSGGRVTSVYTPLQGVVE